jgi:hypothetical protein
MPETIPGAEDLFETNQRILDALQTWQGVANHPPADVSLHNVKDWIDRLCLTTDRTVSLCDRLLLQGSALPVSADVLGEYKELLLDYCRHPDAVPPATLSQALGRANATAARLIRFLTMAAEVSTQRGDRIKDSLQRNRTEIPRDQGNSPAPRHGAIENIKPGYPKPLFERLVFAKKQLAEVEQYIAPESAVLSSLLVRALIARDCTTAEAMWAIYSQIETGRYKATLLAELPGSVNYIVHEHNPPAGLNVVSGVLHIDGEAGDWGLLVITLPKRDGESMEEPQASRADSAPMPQAEAEGNANLGQLICTLEGSERAFVANSHTADRVEAKQGSVAAHWWRIQAAALKFHADPSRMPGIDRLEVLCDELAGGTGLTAKNLRQLRAHLCRLRQCSLQEADTYPLNEAADALEEAASGQGRANRVEGDDKSETSNAVLPEKKAKRSTQRGEGEAKIIAALTKHHKYADGGTLNPEPIGNNALARLAGVSESTVSAFFKERFKGHAKYRALCNDSSHLVAALRMLNGEYSPHLLYGDRLPGEGERDNE